MTAPVTQRAFDLRDIVAASSTSESTVRRAWAKWESGKDDGKFPPPLEFRRKGEGKNAPRVSHLKHVDDWLDRWPT